MSNHGEKEVGCGEVTGCVETRRRFGEHGTRREAPALAERVMDAAILVVVQ